MVVGVGVLVAASSACDGETDAGTTGSGTTATVPAEGGSGGTGAAVPECVADGECTLDDACVCQDCSEDAYCGDPKNCIMDSFCDAFVEGCVCDDCARYEACRE